MLPRVVVVTGPTASGKTAAAVSVCLRLGGEVVSADSMQVYRGMDIGTAKPTNEERKGIPHHLIDVVDPVLPFSVADYVALARPALRAILSRGATPVVCGGTGQYISALVDGLEFHSAPPDLAVRARLLEAVEHLGNPAMLERLAAVDPEAAARLHPNDRKRILRALEVFETSGETLTEMNRRSRSLPKQFDFRTFVLDPDRETLYRRCDARVDRMVDQGLLDEVRRLEGRGVPRSAIAMQAIGYKEMAAHLDGECTLAEAVASVKQATRNYAKRQFTWFRAMKDTEWIPVDDATPEHLADAMQARIMS